jgi:hypothetical protein
MPCFNTNFMKLLYHQTQSLPSKFVFVNKSTLFMELAEHFHRNILSKTMGSDRFDLVMLGRPGFEPKI